MLARTLTHMTRDQVSPFTTPALLGNTASGVIGIECGCRGPNYGVTSACASGCHAIGEAMGMIIDGHAYAILTGGTEAAFTPLCFAGYCAMKAMNTNYSLTLSLSYQTLAMLIGRLKNKKRICKVRKNGLKLVVTTIRCMHGRFAREMVMGNSGPHGTIIYRRYHVLPMALPPIPSLSSCFPPKRHENESRNEYLAAPTFGAVKNRKPNSAVSCFARK
jgi:hypothetical protein